MRYVIRKLDGNCWMDEVKFSSDEKLRGDDMVKRVISEKIASGEIRVFSPSVFCVIEKLPNGRERLVGNEVTVGRGNTIY